MNHTKMVSVFSTLLLTACMNTTVQNVKTDRNYLDSLTPADAIELLKNNAPSSGSAEQFACKYYPEGVRLKSNRGQDQNNITPYTELKLWLVRPIANAYGTFSVAVTNKSEHIDSSSSSCWAYISKPVNSPNGSKDIYTPRVINALAKLGVYGTD
ncbi:MAG: hypothetical protein ABW082_14270 [Sedimenticola sp.]